MIVIANCQIKNRMIPEHHLNRILQDCLVHTGLKEQEICLSFSPLVLQVGRRFEVIINLFLPENLPQGQQQQIQSGLPAIMAKYLVVPQEYIALTTTFTKA